MTLTLRPTEGTGAGGTPPTLVHTRIHVQKRTRCVLKITTPAWLGEGTGEPNRSLKCPLTDRQTDGRRGRNREKEIWRASKQEGGVEMFHTSQTTPHPPDLIQHKVSFTADCGLEQ